MTVSLMRQACRLFPAHNAFGPVPRSTVRHNRRAWLQSVQWLGDKWHLKQQQQRKDTVQ